MRASNRSSRQNGFTLIELSVVLALLGAIAVFATGMLNSTQVVSSLETEQVARTLTAALRTARLTAVSSGKSVQVAAIQEQRRVIGFSLLTTDAQPQRLHPDQRFPQRVHVRWSSPIVRFLPSGMSDRAMTIRITNVEDSQSWQLDVIPATGFVAALKIK